jgi:hypothetical protein
LKVVRPEDRHPRVTELVAWRAPRINNKLNHDAPGAVKVSANTSFQLRGRITTGEMGEIYATT